MINQMLKTNVTPEEFNTHFFKGVEFWKTLLNKEAGELLDGMKLQLETLVGTIAEEIYTTFEDWYITYDKARWLRVLDIRIRKNYGSIIFNAIALNSLTLDDLARQSMNGMEQVRLERTNDGAFQERAGDWENINTSNDEVMVQGQVKNKDVTKYGNVISAIKNLMNNPLSLKGLMEEFRNLFYVIGNVDSDKVEKGDFLIWV